MPNSKPDFSPLAKTWPSAFVAREKVSEFSGGILNPRTLANLDAKKIGPTGRIKIGRKIAYDVEKLIQYMNDRAQAI